ncbi:MAG: malto-oligosyltrehalose trehalohydrolase [Ilumatobacter sp.]|uniref:malto-oligosyltrehalose trehalohydrolase n=1 Tax=Ilumatobacter sp. TaxID=1967498 RepID=UPI00261DB509|nr:malto-oligosyltrehalose trehalohydrolase [Ilumatobacter sp.]MDJ0770012.1 malto-oligosyltrehalose trehalohydrolase [Ilumatobacter sp.]
MTGHGAAVMADGTRFNVWAPAASSATLAVEPAGRAAITVALDRVDGGYWQADVAAVGHGDRYTYSIDGGPPLPDPASGWQPDGVHGASAVVDPRRFDWTDAEWRGRGLDGIVLYELHVGTFTPEGTLDSAIAELPRLAALGVTTIELMPVNAFPGDRNWGYDGVYPYAVQASYGGPEALAHFVDAAHAHGLAVILDVVYNHVGPEGNHMGEFGPYFSTAYTTTWAPAMNVSEPDSDGVRDFYVGNAARWVRDFHVDGFRLDAVHAVFDTTANPFWEQICRAAREAAAASRRRIVLIGETSDNDPRQLAGPDRHGYGFDAVWCDDVHHNLRVAMTGDREGYYADYDGTPAELADTIRHRWKFRGQFSVARGRRHGRPVDEAAPNRFVAHTQNHDQVGNRPHGERPDHHVTAAQRRFAPSAVLLSPYTPMLFQGEEYGELGPFPFFVDHTDAELLRATNEGRKAEFPDADWSEGYPVPGDPATFESAKLDPSVAAPGTAHAQLLAMYTELLRLRREVAPIADPGAVQQVELVEGSVIVRRTLADVTTALAINESDTPAALDVDGSLVFASDAEAWGGDAATALTDGSLSLAPWSVALVVA